MKEGEEGFFHTTNTMVWRSNQSQRVLNTYTDRIPIIIESAKKCQLVDPEITRNLVHKNITIKKIENIVREKFKLKKMEALFFYCNKRQLDKNEIIENIYQKEKNKEDNFLYLTYSNHSQHYTFNP
jgi:hypothetical protein